MKNYRAIRFFHGRKTHRSFFIISLMLQEGPGSYSIPGDLPVTLSVNPL
jgi:hypothetical protein